MSNRHQFIAAVSELEALLKMSASIPEKPSADDRRESARLRRAIAEQNLKITKLGETTFSEKDEMQSFRAETARLRAAISSHLSEWPISTIDIDDVRYRQSLEWLRSAYQTFIAWSRRELPHT